MVNESTAASAYNWSFRIMFLVFETSLPNEPIVVLSKCKLLPVSVSHAVRAPGKALSLGWGRSKRCWSLGSPQHGILIYLTSTSKIKASQASSQRRTAKLFPKTFPTDSAIESKLLTERGVTGLNSFESSWVTLFRMTCSEPLDWHQQPRKQHRDGRHVGGQRCILGTSVGPRWGSQSHLEGVLFWMFEWFWLVVISLELTHPQIYIYK